MKKLWSILLLFSVDATAQCDSASVREWLRTMNHDTVCFSMIFPCEKVGYQSRISYGLDSSGFAYDYTDSVSGRASRKLYYNYRLFQCNYQTPGDTDVNIYYQGNGCAADIIVKSLVNDSLTKRNKKGKPFYEYYSETVYDTIGNLDASWIETIVVKHGKKFRRTVYIRPKRKFRKTRIRMKRVRV